MRTLVEALASGNLIAEVRALGADEATISKPAVSLRDCIQAMNERAEGRVAGRLTKPQEIAIRHYLLELALRR